MTSRDRDGYSSTVSFRVGSNSNRDRSVYSSRLFTRRERIPRTNGSSVPNRVTNERFGRVNRPGRVRFKCDVFRCS